DIATGAWTPSARPRSPAIVRSPIRWHARSASNWVFRPQRDRASRLQELRNGGPRRDGRGSASSVPAHPALHRGVPLRADSGLSVVRRTRDLPAAGPGRRGTHGPLSNGFYGQAYLLGEEL